MEVGAENADRDEGRDPMLMPRWQNTVSGEALRRQHAPRSALVGEYFRGADPTLTSPTGFIPALSRRRRLRPV
jgi:hypothetical protein